MRGFFVRGFRLALCRSHICLDALGAEVAPAVEHPAIHVGGSEAATGAEDFGAAAVLDEAIGPADAFDGDRKAAFL